MGQKRRSELDKYKMHYERLDYKSPLAEYLEALARGAERKLRNVKIPR